MPLRVAIIGAGASGLVSVKQCLDEDIEPVCYEAQGHIGGQWRYTEPDPKTGEVVSSIYRSIIINTSRDTMSMSDFPMEPKKYSIYTHHTKVQEYFESYASFFNLYPHIRFHHKVVSVTPLQNNKWAIEVISGDGETSEQVFDAVFVCTGHHSKPNTPDWQDVELFRSNGGEVLHSHYYREPAPFAGKKVAVVGIGNSGVDICCDLSSIASEMHMITRSGAWVWPRFMFGQAYESYLSRFLLTVVPQFIGLFLMQMGLVLANGVIPAELKPKHNISQAHPTVRSDLFERIKTGTIKPHRASISRFTKSGIELTNGEKLEPLDTVIACTGYQLSFPFLKQEIYQSGADNTNWTHLYRMMVPPEHPTLFFIGLIQPLGAIMPIAEQQTRWATAVLQGHINLPPPATMHERIEKYKTELRHRYISSPRHTIQVDYLPYTDVLARDLGNDIQLWRFIKTFGLWQGIKTINAVYFGMPSAAQYRLFGRGSKSELAKLCMQRIYSGQDVEMSDQEQGEIEKYRRGGSYEAVMGRVSMNNSEIEAGARMVQADLI